MTSKKYIYFEQDKGLLSAIQPATLYVCVGKQLVLTGYSSFVCEKCIPQEEKMKAFPPKLAQAVAKDLVTITVKGCLQAMVKTILSDRLVSKLLKSAPNSALRKYFRSGSRLKASFRIFFTGVYSGILSHAAIFVVSTVISKATDTNRKFKEKLNDNFTKMIGSIGLGALGGALGTIISPGRGTLIGGIIGDSVLYMF
eukprot:Sdes_comp20447_c0_seq2m14633